MISIQICQSDIISLLHHKEEVTTDESIVWLISFVIYQTSGRTASRIHVQIQIQLAQICVCKLFHVS